MISKRDNDINFSNIINKLIIKNNFSTMKELNFKTLTYKLDFEDIEYRIKEEDDVRNIIIDTCGGFSRHRMEPLVVSTQVR